MKLSPIFFLTLGITISNSFAVTVLTSDGNGADSFIRQGEATTNFGASTTLLIKGDDNTTTRKGYLRFDLSTIAQPITVAGLTLTVAINNSGGTTQAPGQFFNVDIYGLTNESLDNWVEGDNGTDNSPVNEITYNNAPANINPGNNFNGDAQFLGTLNVPGTALGDSVTFSNPALVSFLNSDTNGLVTILMRRQAGGNSNLAFASKESDTYDGPQLDLTLVPEPSGSMMVILASGIGLLRRKRA